jgi:hypothetical protein
VCWRTIFIEFSLTHRMRTNITWSAPILRNTRYHLLQSLSNTKLRRCLHVSYKLSKCVCVFGTLYITVFLILIGYLSQRIYFTIKQKQVDLSCRPVSLRVFCFRTERKNSLKTRLLCRPGLQPAVKARAVCVSDLTLFCSQSVCSGLKSQHRSMAQAVSRRPLTAETLFHSRVSPCGICGGQSGFGRGFLRVFRFFSVSIIQPWLSILIYHMWDEQVDVHNMNGETLWFPLRCVSAFQLMARHVTFV